MTDKVTTTPNGEEAKAKETVEAAKDEELRKLKGKGKVVDAEPEDEDDDEGDFDEEADDEEEVDEDEEDEEIDEEEGTSDVDNSNPGKSSAAKRKADDGGGSSKKSKKKRTDDDEDDSEPEIVKNLSGDEVDPSLIIAGGRSTRRGRAQSISAQRYKYEHDAKDSDEDSW